MPYFYSDPLSQIGEIANPPSLSIDGTPILVVDRCALIREGLTRLLEEGGFTVVAAVTDIAGLRLTDERSRMPFLIILGGSSDLAADIAVVRQARMRFRNGVVVVLRRDCDLQDMSVLVRAGASGILPISEDADNLVHLLELTLLGQNVMPVQAIDKCLGSQAIVVPASPASGLPETERPPAGTTRSPLSIREMEILRHLLAGEPNRGIATQLMISEATVKVHVKAILRKIKAKNRTQAAIWALNYMGAADATLVPPLSKATVALPLYLS